MGTQTLETLKENLIFRISKIDKEEALRQVEKAVDLVEHSPKSELLKKLAKPMRKKLDLEELKREQNWKPIDRDEFDRLVKELDIQEPLEQLLADI